MPHSAANTTTATPATKKVAKALDRIRELHQKGRDIRAQASPYHTRKEEADGLKIGIGTVRNRRAFADPVRGYSVEDLENLLTRCRQANFPLSTSHVIYLLNVPKGPKRSAMEKKLLKEHWSIHALDRAIKVKLGLRKAFAGRRPMSIPDEQSAFVELAKVCRRWIGIEKAIERGGLKLPREIQKSMDQAHEHILQLSSAVQDRLSPGK